jgi:hypothetical protein
LPFILGDKSKEEKDWFLLITCHVSGAPHLIVHFILQRPIKVNGLTNWLNDRSKMSLSFKTHQMLPRQHKFWLPEGLMFADLDGVEVLYILEMLVINGST